MAEDDATDLLARQNVPDAAQVVREAGEGNGRVFDQLHRLERRVEARETRARGVAEVPQFRLRAGIQRQRYGARSFRVERASEAMRSVDCRVGSRALHF